MNNPTDTLKIRYRYIRRSILPLVFLIVLFKLGASYPFHSWHPLVAAETLADLEQEADARTRYVEFHTETLWYTGYDYINGQEHLGSCYYAIVEDQCLFFILAPDQNADTLKQRKISGTLTRDLATISKITDGMAEDLSWTAAELNQMASSLLIDETADDRTFYNAGFLLTCLLAGIAALSLIHNLFYILLPHRALSRRRH